jgi:hypothetical protein
MPDPSARGKWLPESGMIVEYPPGTLFIVDLTPISVDRDGTASVSDGGCVVMRENQS